MPAMVVFWESFAISHRSLWKATIGKTGWLSDGKFPNRAGYYKFGTPGCLRYADWVDISVNGSWAGYGVVAP